MPAFTAVNEFLLHFFPLFTIFLFGLSAFLFFHHINSIRVIEKHMESNHPDKWEDLGKPSVFSGKFSEKNIKFREMIEAEADRLDCDREMVVLWQRSKKIRQNMVRATWSAFGMYFFTIVAVQILLDRIAGT